MTSILGLLVGLIIIFMIEIAFSKPIVKLLVIIALLIIILILYIIK